MGFLKKIRNLFRRRKPESQLSPTAEKMPKEPCRTPSFPEQAQELTALKNKIKTKTIALRNIERRKHGQYKYAKFFKHRQPTTARKLWKPDATFEDD